MRETLFESILSADEEEAEARNVLDLDSRIKFPEDDEDYGIDDNGKSVNIGGSTFVFDEAKKELFDNILR